MPQSITKALELKFGTVLICPRPLATAVRSTSAYLLKPRFCGVPCWYVATATMTADDKLSSDCICGSVLHRPQDACFLLKASY